MPSNDPKIVVYVAINNPKRVTQYGGVVAAPVVKNIMLDAIEALDIKEQKTTTEKKYEWYDKKYYTVPNVVGMELKEAKNLLKNFEININGTGNTIIEQSPKEGTRLQEGNIIRLYLGN